MYKNTKKVKFLFSPSEIGEALQNQELERINNINLKNIKEILSTLDSSYNLYTKDIGCGASWVMIVASFTATILGILKLGKEINEGIDGWIEIGKKIKLIINKSNNVIISDSILIDALCIRYIEEECNLKITSLKKVKEYSILKNKNIDKKQMYIRIFKINSSEIKVFYINSGGKIIQLDSFIDCYGDL